MLRTVEMDFDYMNYIENPPRAPKEMHRQAASADGATVDLWGKTWLDQIRANHTAYETFMDKGIGKLYAKHAGLPAIVVGSGPSIKDNALELKNVKGAYPIVSCLHNFHYFVDNEIPCDYFVTLDAGPVTIEEISEGGKETADFYFEQSSNYTLIAFIGTHPDLLKRWKGKVYFYNCPIPDQSYMEQIASIEKFGTWMATGGNVLGASTYFAKAILGCNPLAFVGANFSFSYDKKFHGWDSKYDKSLGIAMRAIDVFGHKVYTWQSYFNFKLWFEWLAITIPGIYINCTEGGTYGAYPEGNLQAIKQMELKAFIRMYSLHHEMEDQCTHPEKYELKILF